MLTRMILQVAVLSLLFATNAGAFLVPSKHDPASIKAVFQRSYCMGLLNETIIVYHDGQYRYGCNYRSRFIRFSQVSHIDGRFPERCGSPKTCPTPRSGTWLLG